MHDFATAQPVLRPGALVLYDDIRWHDPRFAADPADTYKGWQRLVDHPHVAAAAELDEQLGLLLIGS